MIQKIDKQPNIISIAGRSGAGKTTFLEKLIPVLTNRGYHIGVIKHAHCGLQIDKKGKDSWRHKNAGASATLVVSPNKIAMIKDYQEPQGLQEMLDNLDLRDALNLENSSIAAALIEKETSIISDVKQYLSDMDIIIVEGFKYASIPKIEIFRASVKNQTPLFCGFIENTILRNSNLAAFITDSDYRPSDIPIFGLEDVVSAADFIEQQYIL